MIRLYHLGGGQRGQVATDKRGVSVVERAGHMRQSDTWPPREMATTNYRWSPTEGRRERGSGPVVPTTHLLSIPPPRRDIFRTPRSKPPDMRHGGGQVDTDNTSGEPLRIPDSRRQGQRRPFRPPSRSHAATAWRVCAPLRPYVTMLSLHYMLIGALLYVYWPRVIYHFGPL